MSHILALQSLTAMNSLDSVAEADSTSSYEGCACSTSSWSACTPVQTNATAQ